MSAFVRMLCVAVAVLLLVPAALSQVTVAVSPASKTVNMPDQFTIDVVVNNVDSCRAANIRIRFDNTILTYNSVAKGPFLPDAFPPPPLVVVGTPYTEITYSQSVLGTNAYSGSGTLVTYTFTAKAVGTTAIEITMADLRKASGSITSSQVNGSVTVDPPLPITLVSFRATISSEGNYPLLTWKTLSEIDNYGFMVQRKGPGESEFVDLADGFVAGHGTTVDAHEYSYTDKSAGPGEWYYRLKQTDVSGPVHYTDPVQISIITSVAEQGLPTVYALEQNYPNPFNPATMITYQLPAAGHVRLAVLDLLGREVATLVNGHREAGIYKESFNAAGLSSGLYFYQLSAGEQTFLKKMMVVK